MQTAAEHYDALLGDIYIWMVGGIEDAISRGADEIASVLSGRHAEGVAVDLGAGFGMHSIPLAEAGFSVIAIDSCRGLLDHLNAYSEQLPIQTIHGDLEDFLQYCPENVGLICCMGDTITHLPRKQSVRDVVRNARSVLAPGGLFVVSLRNYENALEDTNRFIPVRSDKHRILTCFLEYQKGSVTVHDILHEYSDGHWVQRISAYPKLRLSFAWLADILRSERFDVVSEAGLSGMRRIIGIAT